MNVSIVTSCQILRRIYVSKYLSHGLVETFYRLRVVVDVVLPIPAVHGVVSRCPVV